MLYIKISKTLSSYQQVGLVQNKLKFTIFSVIFCWSSFKVFNVRLLLKAIDDTITCNESLLSLLTMFDRTFTFWFFSNITTSLTLSLAVFWSSNSNRLVTLVPVNCIMESKTNEKHELLWHWTKIKFRFV